MAETFAKVGLSEAQTHRYANEFSGGQRQRIGVARALALSPSLITADEAVSALDVSVQAMVVNLFMDLQRDLGLAYLFIAHDLAVVSHMCHRVVVMYLGVIVEVADRASLFANPQHPCTRGLLSAIPVPDPALRGSPRRVAPRGDIPSPTAALQGCPFHTRCALATEICRREMPQLTEIETNHAIARHHRPWSVSRKS